jgi:hypothetical protein
MPRILNAYLKESFIFTANFIRTVFPISLEALELEREISKETLVKAPDRILQLLREKPTMPFAIAGEENTPRSRLRWPL